MTTVQPELSVAGYEIFLSFGPEYAGKVLQVMCAVDTVQCTDNAVRDNF